MKLFRNASVAATVGYIISIGDRCICKRGTPKENVWNHKLFGSTNQGSGLHSSNIISMFTKKAKDCASRNCQIF